MNRRWNEQTTAPNESKAEAEEKSFFQIFACKDEFTAVVALSGTRAHESDRKRGT